jgi:hypothetical protein
VSPAANAASGGSRRQRSPRKGPQPSLVVLLKRLCEGMEAQAQAIDRLAASNEALVDALYQEEGDEAGATSPHLGAAPHL